MSTGNKVTSILFNKCPRCLQGDFFVTKGAFSRGFDKMHDRCPHCNLNYMPEPGFYWASMFVSYALYTVYILLTFFIVVSWLKVDLTYYLIGLVPITPYFFRLARRTWLNIFVAPDPTKI